jgi:hypothetical protein
VIKFKELLLLLHPQVRMHRHEEEVGEVGDWRIPAVEGDVNQGHLPGHLDPIFQFVPTKKQAFGASTLSQRQSPELSLA